MTTIDRDLLREHAQACRTDPYGIVMSGEELNAILDALEQAEADRDAYRAKMDELDRAYLSEHGQRKRIEEQVRAVRDVLDRGVAEGGGVRLPIPGYVGETIRRALDGDNEA